jgi:hypothetical protein
MPLVGHWRHRLFGWGLGTPFGRPLAAQALFGMTEIPVLMEKCIACEQLLCTFARRELIGKLMGM